MLIISRKVDESDCRHISFVLRLIYFVTSLLQVILSIINRILSSETHKLINMSLDPVLTNTFFEVQLHVASSNYKLKSNCNHTHRILSHVFFNVAHFLQTTDNLIVIIISSNLPSVVD